MEDQVAQGLAQEANNPSNTDNSGLDWLNFSQSNNEDTANVSNENIVPEEQPVTQQPVTNDNDIVRSQYWQSQHDRLRNEVEPWKPVIDLIKQRPELLDVIQERIAPPPEQTLQVPERPVKPSNFNWDDAIGNPESESFKYREAQEGYNDKLATYMLTKEQMREQAYQEQLQQQQAMVQQREQLNQVNNLLTTRYAMQPTEAMEFIQQMSDPQSVTFENLIDLFKLQKQRQMPRANVQPKPYMPIPGGMIPNTGQQTLSPDQAFMNMLKGK